MKINLSETRAQKILVGVILAFASIFVLVVILGGRYTVVLDNTDFTVKAVFSPSTSVPYSEIDNVTIEPDPPAGFRTGGYGSPWLSMGRFKNECFGNYNRYTRSSCTTAIIIKTKQGRYIVVNEATEQQTESLYKKILGKAAM